MDSCVGDGGIQILPTWYQYLEKTYVDGKCQPDFTFPDDITAVLLAVVDILLRIGAIVAIGYIIYGGFLYMLSRGEKEGNVDKTVLARQTIMNAIIGLVLTMFATGIVSFIGGQLAP